jgi:glucose-6-phosphate 1-dehydrogenase
MKKLPPTVLIIIGISGDLSTRKLLPAIAKIAGAGEIPEQFRLIGISRQYLEKAELLAKATGDTDEARLSRYFLDSKLDLMKVDYDSEADFAHLATKLDEIDAEFGVPAQRLYYLSVPPQAAMPIVDQLGISGLSKVPNTKLLLEKPFGVDLSSAKALIEHTLMHFAEEQVYRIDHYMAKEMAQNLLVFRRGNTLFRRTWNKDFIDRIEIIATERIGIEGRTGFYEQTGALRDLVQSHLLQLAALTLMDLPDLDNLTTIRGLRLAALHYIEEASVKTVAKHAVRGQYDSYRTEVENPKSMVETFASLSLESADPKWQGVPITITTGKSLDSKKTEIHIYYHKDDERESNKLTLRIAPNEGIEISLWVKTPGYDLDFACAPLDFVYDQYYKHLPEAYEQVLLDAMRSDQTLFASSKEVLSSWEILAPVQEKWSDPKSELRIYKSGSRIENILVTSKAK